MAVCLQRGHQAQLVFRARAGKDVNRHHFEGKLSLVQPIEIGPGQYAMGILKPDLRGNGGSGARMIARDHLDPDPSRPAFRDGCNGLGARRVDQTEEAEKGKPAFQRSGLNARAPVGPLRQRQHTQAAPRHGVGAVMPMLSVNAAAHLQNPFRRAFHMNQAAQRPVRQNGHEAVPAVEGNGVQPLRSMIPAKLAGEGQQCPFHWVTFDCPMRILSEQRSIIAKRGGKREARQVARRRNAAFRRIAFAANLKCAGGRLHGGHHHFVARQRSGLVGADDRD